MVSQRKSVQVPSPSKLDRDTTRTSRLDLAVAVNVARFASKFKKPNRVFDPEATFCYDSSDGKKSLYECCTSFLCSGFILSTDFKDGTPMALH